MPLARSGKPLWWGLAKPPITEDLSLMRRLRTFLKDLLPVRHWPEIGENTFVLWEPCSASHGEIVPGYTKYLMDLGYHVLVLVTPERIDEGLFARFPEGNFTLARLTQKQIRRFVRSEAIKVAQGILVTTAGKLPTLEDATPDLEGVFGDLARDRIHLVEHNARDRIAAGTWDENLITLRSLVPARPSKVVNPHFFGGFKQHRKSKDRVRFLMVGAARAKRRSDDLVFNAAATLLDDGITNFEIRMIGKPGKAQILERLEPHFITLGRLSFADMYDEIEAADYILSAFQKDGQDHAFYRTTGTSGSFQLACGFNTPIVLQELFTEGTAFNSDNAILYDQDRDFEPAVHRAITLSAEEYLTLTDNLQKASNDLRTASLANMKDVIDG